MAALCYGTGSGESEPDTPLVKGSSENYILVFNGCRVSQEQMAEICSLIEEGKRISAIEY